jgi:hypothetical protein
VSFSLVPFGLVFFFFGIQGERSLKGTIIGGDANNENRNWGNAPTIPPPNGTHSPITVDRDSAIPWVLRSVECSGRL